MAGIRSSSTDLNYVLIGNAHDGATGHMAWARPEIARPTEINGKQALLVYKHKDYDVTKKIHIYEYERTEFNVSAVRDTMEG